MYVYVHFRKAFHLYSVPHSIQNPSRNTRQLFRIIHPTLFLTFLRIVLEFQSSARIFPKTIRLHSFVCALALMTIHDTCYFLLFRFIIQNIVSLVSINSSSSNFHCQYYSCTYLYVDIYYGVPYIIHN